MQIHVYDISRSQQICIIVLCNPVNLVHAIRFCILKLVVWWCTFLWLVIILYILFQDFEGEKIEMTYSKNGEDLGTCFEIEKDSLGENALFPHVLTKNCEFQCNFGEQVSLSSLIFNLLWCKNIHNASISSMINVSFGCILFFVKKTHLSL